MILSFWPFSLNFVRTFCKAKKPISLHTKSLPSALVSLSRNLRQTISTDLAQVSRCRKVLRHPETQTKPRPKKADLIKNIIVLVSSREETKNIQNNFERTS